RLPPCVLFLFYIHRAPPHLHSFPTRRSSDLRPRRRTSSSRDGASCGRSAASASTGKSGPEMICAPSARRGAPGLPRASDGDGRRDRKSTRLNSSHGSISYAVFCLKKKKKNEK